MTDNLVGKRVRATLGENVLVGEVIDQGVSSEFSWWEIGAPGINFTVWETDEWTIEPLPDPLPTAPYSLVVPPADDPSSFPYVLLPYEHNAQTWSKQWFSGTTHGTEATVQEMVTDHGWRVIPGPAD
jgi:hypothetical protein